MSNPSETGTGEAKPPTCAPYGGGVGLPRKFQNLDILECIFPAFQGITNCMIERAFLTRVASINFAGETTSIVQRDRIMVVAPNWAMHSIFAKMKLRQQ